jgi:tetratricopeptide (TPR) repeat protein
MTPQKVSRMSAVICELWDLPGNPAVRIDLEDGTVLGLEAVLPLLHEPGAARQLIQVLIVAGEMFENSGSYGPACSLYAAAVRVAEKVENPINHSTCLNTLALAYKHQGKYDDAIRCYEKAIALVEKQLAEPALEEPRPACLANFLSNLAILYRLKRDEEKMRRYAAWAQQIVSTRRDAASLRVAEECREMLG